MKTFTPFVLVAFGLFGGACSNSDPAGGEDDPEKTGATLGDYAASWEGHVEAYTFPSGSDRVRLTLDSSGNGTLVLGEDWVPWPAPFSPSIWWFKPIVKPKKSPSPLTMTALL